MDSVIGFQQGDVAVELDALIFLFLWLWRWGSSTWCWTWDVWGWEMIWCWMIGCVWSIVCLWRCCWAIFWRTKSCWSDRDSKHFCSISAANSGLMRCSWLLGLCFSLWPWLGLASSLYWCCCWGRWWRCFDRWLWWW